MVSHRTGSYHYLCLSCTKSPTPFGATRPPYVKYLFMVQKFIWHFWTSDNQIIFREVLLEFKLPIPLCTSDVLFPRHRAPIKHMSEGKLWITLVPMIVVHTSGLDPIMVIHDVSIKCLTVHFVCWCNILKQMCVTEAASFHSYINHIDGLVQHCSNSIDNALGTLQCCTKQ